MFGGFYDVIVGGEDFGSFGYVDECEGNVLVWF